MPELFHTLINEASLARLAGEKSFARVAGYFAGGAVIDLMQTRSAILGLMPSPKSRKLSPSPAGTTKRWLGPSVCAARFRTRSTSPSSISSSPPITGRSAMRTRSGSRGRNSLATTRLETDERLEKAAGRARTWKGWREKALDYVRAELGRPDRSRGTWHWTAGGKTLLVEVFLHEGDSDTALAEAKAGGCRRDIWMQLARAREKDHPLDAVAIHRDAIDPIVERKNNEAYDEAAALVQKIGALMGRAGQKAKFAAWLEALRVKHKAKRNFMQRIEGPK